MKTTSMETVGTGVIEKNKEHNLRSKDKAEKSCDVLIHWGRVTHICVSKLSNLGSDNGLSPGRHQAII